ncbi:hypothetical protein ACE198_00195 [Neobacillus sp. KR4-4]|uniref:hypothetical protein n=1 Tax=Neobacillus sp. KR4-4 TaxID=3344872 RepID=UPI0035CAB14C
MLVSPENFDTNEWFVTISIVVTYTFILLLPKRFPLSIAILMLLFSMAYAQVIDHILAGTKFDLYDINDVEKYEWFDFIAWFLYPPFGYAFVYFYDKWSVKGVGVFWYIVSWAIISLGVEVLSFKLHVFTYKGWKFSYSFPIYLVTLCIYLLFFLFLKGTFEKLKRTPIHSDSGADKW